MNRSLVSSTNVDTLLFARHKSAIRDLTLNVAPNIRPPKLFKWGQPNMTLRFTIYDENVRRPHSFAII